MVGQRDLLEAHSCHRRRLVRALVSGAAGGRGGPSTDPGRTLLGGVALALLLVGGAVASSALASRAALDGTDTGRSTPARTGATSPHGASPPPSAVVGVGRDAPPRPPSVRAGPRR